MADRLKVTLRYSGPDVDDGTMPMADLVAALQGFAGAYGKIAARYTPEAQHELRVSAVKTESFEVLILAWIILGQASGHLQALEVLANASRWVVASIAKLIQTKKHAKGQPYSIQVKGDSNAVVIVNAQNCPLEVPREVFEMFKTRMIDSDLNRIASPLRPGRIDRAELIAADEDETIEAEVESADRPYFEVEEIVTTASRETEVDGYLVSLNKEHNRGTFRLLDGNSVQYRYRGCDPFAFHREFSYRGPVRVRCVAGFDENLKPTGLDVTGVERLQSNLPFGVDGD